MGILIDEASSEELEEAVVQIDFKMVTFSLAGKAYGIDIMKVDGIAKASNFTYVPNSPPFVLGVYNLRGEIISIIDLRKMFNLEITARDDLEDVIIIRIEDNLLGIVVDSIDKVVGISSESIQPPHPLFQDVNIKYIMGVVENEDNLYILLDVDRIFGLDEELTATPPPMLQADLSAVKEAVPEKSQIELDFIIETLATFGGFYVSDLNRSWVEKRFDEWRELRNSQKLDFQLTNPEDASEFLKPFFSPYTGRLWGEDYEENLGHILPASYSGVINVWNPGSGDGHESYSLACLLRKKYADRMIKVWANDSNLLKISEAPNLILSAAELEAGSGYADFIKETQKGCQFIKEIKDLMIFEYHDILHGNQYTELDIIVARDLLSFLKPADQVRIIQEFRDMLKENGLLILGYNERIVDKNWVETNAGNLLAYRIEKE